MKTNLTASDVRGHEHSLLCLIEDASLDVLPVGRGWAISDPEAAGFVLGDGPTVDAAVLAALPAALADGYVDSREVDALLDGAEPDECWRCDGSGEGVTPLYVCIVCRGSGVAS